MDKLYKYASMEAKKIDEEKYTIEGVFSTETKDRHGDIVLQNWDLKQFKKNPVILNNHKGWDIEDVLGKAVKIGVSEGKLQGKIQFAVDENPKAKTAFDLVKSGFLNTFSVGFIPKEWDKNGTITKSELLEVSLVLIPANPEAVVKSETKAKLYELQFSKDITDEEDNGDIAEADNDSNEDRGGAEDEEDINNGGDENIEDTDNDEGAEQGQQEEDSSDTDEAGEDRDEDTEQGGGIEGESETTPTDEQTVEEKRVELLNLIAIKAKEYSEMKKVATRSQESVRAETNRLINKAVRELIKNKK